MVRALSGALTKSRLAEELEQGARCFVCDGQRLNRKFLLGLQRAQPCGGFFHVGVGHGRNAHSHRVDQVANELGLIVEACRVSTQRSGTGDCCLQEIFDLGESGCRGGCVGDRSQ